MSPSIPVHMLDLSEEPALGEVSYTTNAGQIVPFLVFVAHGVRG
jgi:hypothetical protein